MKFKLQMVNVSSTLFALACLIAIIFLFSDSYLSVSFLSLPVLLIINSISFIVLSIDNQKTKKTWLYVISLILIIPLIISLIKRIISDCNTIEILHTTSYFLFWTIIAFGINIPVSYKRILIVSSILLLLLLTSYLSDFFAWRIIIEFLVLAYVTNLIHHLYLRSNKLCIHTQE